MILVKNGLSILITVCVILCTLGFVGISPPLTVMWSNFFPACSFSTSRFSISLGCRGIYLFILIRKNQSLKVTVPRYFDFWVVYISRCRSSALDKTKTAIIFLWLRHCSIRSYQVQSLLVIIGNLKTLLLATIRILD